MTRPGSEQIERKTLHRSDVTTDLYFGNTVALELNLNPPINDEHVPVYSVELGLGGYSFRIGEFTEEGPAREHYGKCFDALKDGKLRVGPINPKLISSDNVRVADVTHPGRVDSRKR